MKMFSIWKLLRKIQRIRIRGPFICHMPLEWWTWNIPPPVICVTEVQNREYIPGWIPLSPISCSHTLGHTRHIILPCYALWCFDCSVIYCVPPSLLLSGRPWDRCRYPCDRLHRRRTLLLPEQPGKPPLDHQISPTLLSILLALE